MKAVLTRPLILFVFTLLLIPSVAVSAPASIGELVGGGCRGAISFGLGAVQEFESGDRVCVYSADGGSWCFDVESYQLDIRAASNDYSCANGRTVGNGVECGDCTTGTGSVADCKSCCNHFYDGADLICCKRSYCN